MTTLVDTLYEIDPTYLWRLRRGQPWFRIRITHTAYVSITRHGKAKSN